MHSLYTFSVDPCIMQTDCIAKTNRSVLDQG